MRGISVVYVTHRNEPRFDWFADSFAAECGDADVEVVFVDGLHSPDRTDRLGATVRERFPFRHVPPKPTPYNGPHRLTRRDYFAAASARNTGIVHATRPYVVFVDDAAVLMPGWWSEVREAARHEYVVAGAYQKRWEMLVEHGVLLRSRVDRSGFDTRWPQGRDDQTVPARGSHLFGCSFGVPRKLLLAVNGLDELCDVVGGEDAQLGVRLEHLGIDIRYSRRMLTIESEERHRQGSCLLRLDKVTDPATYMRRLRGFGLARRATDGRSDNSHMIVDVLHGTRQVQALGNSYHLRILSPRNMGETLRHFPRTHWFDGQPLAEM